MHFSDSTHTNADLALDRANAGAVLVREAGVPFQPQPGEAAGGSPFAEWLSLMEVVQMLCPVWPVRDEPLHGNHWRI